MIRSDRVRYTADIIVATPDRHVLLIQRGRKPYAGYWALPGGRVGHGETSRDAAVRELAEKTGVHVTPAALDQLGAWDEPGRHPRGRYVTVAYLVHVATGTTVTAGDRTPRRPGPCFRWRDEVRAVQWWSLDALPVLAFDHAAVLGSA